MGLMTDEAGSSTELAWDGQLLGLDDVHMEIHYTLLSVLVYSCVYLKFSIIKGDIDKQD